MTPNGERRPLQTDGVPNLILSALAWPLFPETTMQTNRNAQKASQALDALLGRIYGDLVVPDQTSAREAYYHLKALGLMDSAGFQIGVLKGEEAA